METPPSVSVFIFTITLLFFQLSVIPSEYVDGKKKPIYVQPEQIHLSYGAPNEMIVTWSTFSRTPKSVVEYGVKSMNILAFGKSKLFVNPDLDFHSQFIHTVLIKRLEPGVRYMYHCGSSKGWSNIFTFVAMPDNINWAPSIALFGDLGNVNAQSLPRLQEETQRGMYDAIFHVGDFAYDMHDNHGQVGDEFMRQIEPIAANLPYMTCPGNHEAYGNFSNYRNRFHMPGDIDSNNMFYSFNIGRAHVISISTEFYFFVQYGVLQILRQYDWLIADLKEANKPENRARYPWIITIGHRPMYCSNNDKDDCTRHESIIRTGIPIIHLLGLENLFYKYGVDLAIWAHEHSYERLYPVYNRKMYNTSSSHPYTNPKATVHITTGSAGCQERHDGFMNHTAEWSAFHSSDYGYTRMKIHNASHIYLEQVSDDKKGAVIDKMWLVKDKHEPFGDQTLRYHPETKSVLHRSLIQPESREQQNKRMEMNLQFENKPHMFL